MHETINGAESEVDELMDDAEDGSSAPVSQAVPVGPALQTAPDAPVEQKVPSAHVEQAAPNPPLPEEVSGNLPRTPQRGPETVNTGQEETSAPAPLVRVAPKTEFWVEIPYRPDLIKKAKKQKVEGLLPVAPAAVRELRASSRSGTASRQSSRTPSRAEIQLDGRFVP